MTSLSTGFAVACSSSSGTPSLSQACTDMADALSQRTGTCYDVSADSADLINREVRSCVLDSSAPGSQVGESYWESCATTANNGCAAFQCPAYPAGTRQNGAPCLESFQCASLWCRGTAVPGANGTTLPDGVQCGTCASRLPQGDACDVVADACEVGLSCFQGKCRPLGQQGAPCASWNDCAAPAYVCKSSGTCDTITPDGQPCQTSDDCTTDTGCDVTTKLCTPAQYGQPGQACDGQVLRCTAGSCNQTTGTCPQVLADGAACNPADPSTVCDDYARCFQGTCQIPDPSTCH